MDIFKKKDRPRRFGRRAEIEEKTATPIYAPHQCWTPQDYYEPALLAALEDEFEKKCKSWLTAAKPDQFNGSYMDAIIEKHETEALVQLSLQRVDHMSAVDALIMKLWKGDRIRAEARLRQNKEELTMVETELHKLEKIYWSGTSLGEAEGKNNMKYEEDEKDV